MNKAGRERLQKVRAELEDIQSLEQEAFDNLPESFQNGEQGERMQEAIDAIQEALDAIDNVP